MVCISNIHFGRGIGKYHNWEGDLAVRVEPYPILSATASTTESSGRNLSRFTLSHIEALGYVMPPWHSDEELMISIRQLLTPHMCGGCG